MKTSVYASLILIVSLFFSDIINAQPWMQSPYMNKSKGDDISFYDIKNAFNNWAEGKDLEKIKGWKRYKRWEWFYEQRVDEEGHIPDPAINWKEWKSFNDRYGNIQPVKNRATWVSIAPNEIPPATDSTGIFGMGRINCIAFHPADTNTLWVGASQGGVWKTTNYGETWTCLTDDIPVIRISHIAVDPDDPQIIYIATGDIDYIGFPTISQGRITQFGVGVLKTTDGGQTWNTTGLSFELTDEDYSLLRKIIIHPDNTDELIAAGANGIYRSSDAGDSWTRVNENVIIDMETNPLNPNTLFASTFWGSYIGIGEAMILKSVDFGNTWDTLPSGIPGTGVVQRIELAVTPADTNYIYALTCGTNEGLYAIYKSIDAGESWFTVAAYDTIGHPGAAEAPNLLGWGDGGLTGFMPDEGGQGTYDLTLIVDQNDPDKVYSGGVNMWGSDDGGVTWDIVSMWVKLFGNSIHADQHHSLFHPLTGKFFQTHDGGFNITSEVIIGDFNYVFTNCVDWEAVFAGDLENALLADCYELPTQWESIAGGIHNTEYYRLGCCRSHADMIIGGTQDNGTYLYKDGTWINTLGGDGMECMIHHTNPDIIFATNYNGALSRSDDGGLTYTGGLDTVITQVAGEQGDWVTPFVMHPHGPDTIFAAFQSIWKSGDLGNTWTKLGTIPSGSPFRALEVSYANPGYIYTARPGAVFRTKDGGQNWDNITSGLSIGISKVTGIATDYEDPEKVWITISGYQEGVKVYMSDDAGDNWTNISGNLPNVSMNTIVFQAGTINGITGALYTGSDIGVFYTNDSLQGTASPWIMFSYGLPNVVVNELEIHYGAQKLRAATYGRGLWETDFCTEVNEIINHSSDVCIYPNPNKGVFIIEINLETPNTINIEVFTLTGKNVLSITEKANKNYLKQINISDLANGTYIVQVEINNCHYTSRIIKK